MTDAPLVSLVMPVHNRAHLLDVVLDSLARNTTLPNVELVTVDDGSTDESGAMLDAWAERAPQLGMRVIHQANGGAIAALNTGLNAARGEFCVQLDDDVTIETEGWIERMLDLMLIDDSVGVVTPKVIYDSGDINTCGVSVVVPEGWHERPTPPAEKTGERQWLSRVATRIPEGKGGEAESRPAEVDSGMGCCMMYRREDALAAGGYDAGYSPVWFDDVDLCLGIRSLGRKAFYIPDVQVIHHFTARRDPEGRFARLHPLRILKAIARRTLGKMPLSWRAAVERRIDIDLEMHFTRAQCARLRHHHAYWRQKWGWDARNPDMELIRRRYGDTEICWASDPARVEAGKRILEAYEARRRQPL